MRVTRIERQRRKPHRVSVFLDGKFAFGVHIDVFRAAGITTGDELSREAVNVILAQEEFSLAKDHALRYLSYRRRSEKELNDRLLQKEFDPGTISAVIAELLKLGLVDDVQFARAFVHDTLLRKASGKKLLEQLLRRKGVSPDIIARALREGLSQTEEELCALSEAERIINRYRTSRKVTDQRTQQRRLAQHLVRRGFGWETIAPVIKRVFGTSSLGGLG